MRFVHVTVPAGKKETALKTLDDQDVDYVVTDETSGREYTAVVSFPLPVEAVEPVLDSLRDAGLSEEAFTVVVDAETVVSRRFERLKERYQDQAGEDRIAREELLARAQDLAPNTVNYSILTTISIVIATAGLLLDSPAVVVGSMVIAPLIGPAMATSVGTVIDDSDLTRRGVKLQVIGFALGIAAATVFAFLIRTLLLVPPGLDIFAVDEIAERIAPGFLTLVIALGAGVAGAMSLRSGVSAALVGVMIAVALVPPTAVIGIGIAWGLPVVVLGSTVLVMVNALSINLAALLTFWYSGYRPSRWFREDEARSALAKRAALMSVAILVLSAFLGGVTYGSYQAAITEEEIRSEVVDTIEGEYPELAILDVQIIRGDDPLTGQPTAVIVTVTHPGDDVPPGIATVLDQQLAEYDVGVEVRFIETQREP